MSSFDVVSRLDFQEIDNAIGNALREIGNRYDFKGSHTTIERKDTELVVVTDDELKLKQVHDLIVTHFVRRKVDPLCLSPINKEKAGNNNMKSKAAIQTDYNKPLIVDELDIPDPQPHQVIVKLYSS